MRKQAWHHMAMRSWLQVQADNVADLGLGPNRVNRRFWGAAAAFVGWGEGPQVWALGSALLLPGEGGFEARESIRGIHRPPPRPR